jgi:hypothetical protein
MNDPDELLLASVVVLSALKLHRDTFRCPAERVLA